MSHIAVVGLGFGDEGKGTITDWLCRDRPVDFVVRFNGGGQAAHNVVTPEGKHHTFSHFGSGTLAGVPTMLSRFMVINPMGIQNESQALETLGVEHPRESLWIDSRAMVVLPPHVGLLKAREASRKSLRHGSTNFGLAEVMRFALEQPGKVMRIEDVMGDPRAFVEKYLALEAWAQRQIPRVTNPRLSTVSDYVSEIEQRQLELQAALGDAHIVQSPSQVVNLLGFRRDLVFEGSQGVLLDEWHGFHPFTTWSTTTFENVYTLLAEWGNPHPVEKLGVLRSYHTRHGPGPFPTFDPELTLKFNEEHNKTEGGMGEFRAGHFDSVLARYAITVCGGIDSMALTHMDRAEESRVCTSYYPEDPGYSHGVLKPYSVRTDLAGQAKLTEKLSQVAPRYSNRTFMKWYKDKDLFSADTVLVESYGPSASDKRVPSRRKLQTA